MKICPDCGAELEDQELSCQWCGYSFLKPENFDEEQAPQSLEEPLKENPPEEASRIETPSEPVSATDVSKSSSPNNYRLLQKIIVLLSCAVLILLVAVMFACHIFCIHRWNDATCVSPKICAFCQKTSGEALGHEWSEATCEEDSVCARCNEIGEKALGHQWAEAACTTPQTCIVCGKTEGEALGHTWDEATCLKPKTCRICGEAEGTADGHSWMEATYEAPKTCKLCGETEGEKLEITSLEAPSVHKFSKKVNAPGADGSRYNVTGDAVSWEPVNYADGYEVSFSILYSFYDGYDTYTNEGGYKSFSISNTEYCYGDTLTLGLYETYLQNFKVRAYKNTDSGKIYSDWSSALTLFWPTV